MQQIADDLISVLDQLKWVWFKFVIIIVVNADYKARHNGLNWSLFSFVNKANNWLGLCCLQK